MYSSKQFTDVLVRAGLLDPDEVRSIAELTIKAVDGGPVTMHVKRIGDARLDRALAVIDPAGVTREEE